ncbi:MAG: M48 family metallopeptidase [candidate division WOR-3 bacterium]
MDWYREEASVFLFNRVQHWAKIMRVRPGRTSVRDQRTRWGSCSSAGNISLSFRLIMVPEPMSDYVVVHELAHIKHKNHSKDFWGLVGRFIPDYKERRRWLGENRGKLIC